MVFHPENHVFKQYLTPEKTGGVRVIGEKGDLIIDSKWRTDPNQSADAPDTYAND